MIQITQRLSNSESTSDPVQLELFRSCNIQTFPFDDRHEIVYANGNRVQKILPRHVVQLLRNCQAFDTLENHARRYCHESTSLRLQNLTLEKPKSLLVRLFSHLHDYATRNGASVEFGRNQVESIKRDLAELVDAGLLVAKRHLIEECGKSLDLEDPPPRICHVGLASCDRPVSLRHAATSYIRNTKKFGRPCGFVIVDDSKSPHVRSQNRQVLESLKTLYGADISYAGFEQRACFAEKLAKFAMLPPATVNFALLGLEKCAISTGAARNSLLLHTIGECFLNADDDTLCQLAQVPAAKTGVAVTSQPDPTEFWFFPSHEATLRTVTLVEKDVIGIHQQLLGRNLGSCLADVEPDELDLNEMSAEFVDRLRSGRCRVLGTSIGLVGDSGIGSSGYFYMEPNSLKRLARSESDYLAAVASRQVLRCVTRATISDGRFCMTASLGLDNRLLLPPFMPVGRNSDGIFGVLLRGCLKDASWGFLPWALLHVPPDIRRQSFEALWNDLQGVHLCDIVQTIIQSGLKCLRGTSGQMTLQRMGRFLTEIAELPLLDFEEFLRLHFWKEFSARQVQVEQSLQTNRGTPRFLAKYRAQYLFHLRRGIERGDYIVPLDLRDKCNDLDDARNLSRRLVHLLGEVLRSWPDIVQAAKDLRTKGVSLAQPI